MIAAVLFSACIHVLHLVLAIRFGIDAMRLHILAMLTDPKIGDLQKANLHKCAGCLECIELCINGMRSITVAKLRRHDWVKQGYTFVDALPHNKSASSSSADLFSDSSSVPVSLVQLPSPN